MKKLYVGNLPWSTTEEDLTELFSGIGNVHSAKVITDRETGRSRGFGFVEMDAAAADKAIEELNGKDYGSRALRINEANDRRPRGSFRGAGTLQDPAGARQAAHSQGPLGPINTGCPATVPPCRRFPSATCVPSEKSSGISASSAGVGC